VNKDEIMQALKLTAMGRVGHPLQEQLADKLEAVFANPGCDVCTTPGGEHMRGCPNNPLPEAEQDVVGARVVDGVTVAVKRGPGRPPKAKAD
jgi:hypothetical protein